jgi:RNase H-fold protein (predicted Holliday junction resolvase)
VGDEMVVLAIDPGNEKCGVAIVAGGSVSLQEVLERQGYAAFLQNVTKKYDIDHVVIGDGTRSSDFLRETKQSFPDLEVTVVDEKFSTEEARSRYWLEHRPTGWRRLLPTSMQVPPEPYDDYVAVILAERFIAGKA